MGDQFLSDSRRRSALRSPGRQPNLAATPRAIGRRRRRRDWRSRRELAACRRPRLTTEPMS